VKVLLVKPRPHLRTVLGLQGFTLLEPLELGYLAAAVPPGHEVRVLDLRLRRRPESAFVAALRAFRPDLIGLSGYTHEASTVKRLARLARARLPQAFVVVGGHHATVCPADYDERSIDAIVRGEGCAPFRAIVGALSRGEEPLGIPNVLLTGERFDSEQAASWPVFPDPATLPLPRRDLWDPGDYRSVWVRADPRAWQSIMPTVAMVRSSFGCRMKCSFCVVPYLCGGEHRPRPVASVVDEIAAVLADHVYFCDDENFIDEDFAARLAEALARRGVRKRYFAWTRSTTVNRSPELLRAWRAIGLDGVFLGFEFASDEELREVHKGGSVAANQRALDTLGEIGVAVHAAFMVRPEYREGEFEDLAAYVRGMPPAQSSFTVCTPSPGTPDYREMAPRIWVDNPHDLHDCMHPLTSTALPLVEFARRFADLVGEGVARTPLRVGRRPVPPGQLLRVTLADTRYRRAFRELYRDYPRELWSRSG
jgi:hopanoid C-3 methylase